MFKNIMRKIKIIDWKSNKMIKETGFLSKDDLVKLLKVSNFFINILIFVMKRSGPPYRYQHIYLRDFLKNIPSNEDKQNLLRKHTYNYMYEVPEKDRDRFEIAFVFSKKSKTQD